MRGSKHWPKAAYSELWTWIEQRLPQIFEQIKPDTINIWEGMLTVSSSFLLYLQSLNPA